MDPRILRRQGLDRDAAARLGAIKGLPPSKRKKSVYVISTDTLVENPIVAAWVSKSLRVMGRPQRNKSSLFSPVRSNRESAKRSG